MSLANQPIFLYNQDVRARKMGCKRGLSSGVLDIILSHDCPTVFPRIFMIRFKRCNNLEGKFVNPSSIHPKPVTAPKPSTQTHVKQNLAKGVTCKCIKHNERTSIYNFTQSCKYTIPFRAKITCKLKNVAKLHHMLEALCWETS